MHGTYAHKPKLKGSDDCSTTYECKDDQSQSYCSLGPPFYQLILLVFGLNPKCIYFLGIDQLFLTNTVFQGITRTG